MYHCPTCHNEIMGGAPSCPYCGTRLMWQQVQPINTFPASVHESIQPANKISKELNATVNDIKTSSAKKEKEGCLIPTVICTVLFTLPILFGSFYFINKNHTENISESQVLQNNQTTSPATVNKTKLSELVETCKKLEPSDYTTESWDELQLCLTTAENMIASDEVTQNEIDLFFDATKKAKSNLKVVFKPESFQVIPYEDIARNPSNYSGKKIQFSGRVVQTIEDTPNFLRVATDGKYDDIILVTYYSFEVSSRILKDDIITIYGVFKGLESYESTLGGKITIPYISAERIDFEAT